MVGGFRAKLALLCVAFLFLEPASILLAPDAAAIGVVAPVPNMIVKPRWQGVSRSQHRPTSTVRSLPLRRKISRSTAGKRTTQRPAAKPRVPVPLPQNLVGSLKSKTIVPGVVHKYYRGALSINVIDIDMVNADVQVRPVLAGYSFPGLKDVKDQVDDFSALAGINANYFKKDGTPLGTLIIDKEWVAGPLYDRVSLGISRSGYVRIDKVNLHGTLETSNPDVGCLWVNNINQPRRSGSRLIVYTRRWNCFVRMPSAGCLVAVGPDGRVVDTANTSIGIPWGGFVLSDRKGSAIGNLKRGDQVKLGWHVKPDDWSDVVHAVSGGPILIKNGKMFVDLKGEKFNRSWTGSHIKARTAAGVTWKNHLLLVTVEGPHTLWDLTKFFDKLGAADAMNLDGGGSTTMVVKGRTVTRNGNSYQRRVANALAVIPSRPPASGLSASASAAWQIRHISLVSKFEELVPTPGSGAPPAGRADQQLSGLAPDVISSNQSSPENVESLVDTP